MSVLLYKDSEEEKHISSKKLKYSWELQEHFDFSKIIFFKTKGWQVLNWHAKE